MLRMATEREHVKEPGGHKSGLSFLLDVFVKFKSVGHDGANLVHAHAEQLDG